MIQLNAMPEKERICKLRSLIAKCYSEGNEQDAGTYCSALDDIQISLWVEMDFMAYQTSLIVDTRDAS